VLTRASEFLRPYRRLLAAAGVGLAVAGSVAGTYVLVADGLARRSGHRTPVVAADGIRSDAPSDDPAVTVLRPTPSPAPEPTAAPRHSLPPGQLAASAASRAPDALRSAATPPEPSYPTLTSTSPTASESSRPASAAPSSSGLSH
jgi:hypothetical protein